MQSLPGLAEPTPLPKLDVIYQPQGRAREYSDYALNIFEGKCPHECGYCFAEHLPAACRKDRDPAYRPKADILARVERDCERIERAGGWPEENGPVLLCFTGDPYPFGRFDLQAVTDEVIVRLGVVGVPVTVLSKNGVAVKDRVAGRGPILFTPEQVTVATSIVFADLPDSAAVDWEVNAPHVYYRWQALEVAHRYGFRTWVSVEPVIDPDEALEVIRHGLELGCVGHYRIGPLNHHPHAATVDWPRFGERLAEVLVETGARYYLKHDMRKYMPPGFPPDNREED